MSGLSNRLPKLKSIPSALLFTLAGVGLGSQACFSAEPTPAADAWEQPNCETRLFEQLKVVEKTSNRLPVRTPKGKLRQYIDQFEVLCPWQAESDVNGDKVADWIGIVGERGNYSLVAWVSQGISYKLHTIKSYPKFPEDTLIRTYPSDHAKSITGKAHVAVYAKNVIVENVINAVSTVWYWDGKGFSELGGFIDKTKLAEDEDRPKED